MNKEEKEKVVLALELIVENLEILHKRVSVLEQGMSNLLKNHPHSHDYPYQKPLSEIIMK
jgi:hypothetical protein